MRYYTVALRTPRQWKGSSFTYHSEDELQLRLIVQVPFGKSYRVGVVVEATSKPRFETKPVYLSSGHLLPESSRRFMEWFGAFYAANENDQNSLLLPAYLRVPKKLEGATQTKKTSIPEMSTGQEEAFDQVIEASGPSLLRGVTGSGKTRIYLHLIAKNLQQGKSSLLLLPEILLTTQVVKELEQYFSCVVFHSGLTDSQRSKLWFRILGSEEPLVVIGARSSLFLPFQNLGLVVIDEAHDSAYKQENDVRYNSLLAAGGLVKTHNARLVLGSATPPVSESFLLLESGGSLVDLPEKAITAPSDSKVTIIDRNERKHFSKHPLLSNELIEQIAQSLKEKKQTLLFLNRRGTARLLSCENGDWHAECPRCDLPLTYHHDSHQLLCHSCGYKQSPSSICPECKGQVKPTSMGVKSIVSDVQKLFPKTTIGRYDSDTAAAESFHKNYDEIKAGGVDIIIGTQQLTKGLDLPLLETVGIINADLPLNFPDYSSSERQFQLIAQVAGRVNRGHGAGRIIVQTSDPSNPVIQQALVEDWHSFYKSEVTQRKLHNFPPSLFAAKVLFRSKTEKSALTAAKKAQKLVSSAKVTGPMPSFHAKRGGHYYYQLILTAKNRSNLLKDLKDMPKEALIDIDPVTFL